MQRTATCACGDASITVGSDPEIHAVCHCTNCKRRTGSAFGISAYFPKASVTAKRGDTTVYAFHHAAKGHDQQRHFCSRCGTTLFWYISALPGLIGIAGGCFADEGLPEPTLSLTHHEMEDWLTVPETWAVRQA